MDASIPARGVERLRLSFIGTTVRRGFEAKLPSARGCGNELSKTLRVSLHPARGLQKRVPLKLYVPNTIHAYDCCHVTASEARVVLKSPWVKPAAACGMRGQSRMKVRAVALCHRANGVAKQLLENAKRSPWDTARGVQLWPQDPSCRRPAQGHTIAKAKLLLPRGVFS